MVISGPARGKDFFDRKKEIKDIIECLKKENIRLVAPRRYGKTSIMLKIEEKFEKMGKNYIFIDVHYVESPQEFIMELIRNVSKIKKRV